MKRERKRLLAALLAFALTFVTIMSDVQIVKAKGPTIVKIYGTLSEWGDPQNLEIADEAPQGKILIAKMVSDGKYNLVDGDLDIALVLNNAETTIERETGVTYIPEKWQMAGNSCISFDGMEITSSDGNFPAFPSEDMNDVNEILAFFQKYPYADEMDFMTGEIIDPMIPYDVTITGDYTLNDVWANTFTVAEGAEFTLAPMYRQTGFDPSTGTRTYDTLSSGGILDGNRFVINGKFITLEGDRIENHPNLALYENGSLIVGENASFDLAEGTELILSDYVTCSGVTLYQYVDEEDAYGNVYPVLQSFEMDDKHGREEFSWEAEDGARRWIRGYHEATNGNFVTDYVTWYDPDIDDNQGKIFYVNGDQDVYVNPWEEAPFTAGQTIHFKMQQPEERAPAVPIVIIDYGFGRYHKEYSSISENPRFKITLTQNEQTGDWEFDYTQATEKNFKVHVDWSPFDAFWKDDSGEEMVVHTMKSGGGNVTAAVTPVRSLENEYDPNEIKYIVRYDSLEDDSIVFTLTPDEGKVLRDVFVHLMGDGIYGEDIREYSSADENRLPIDDYNGFTEMDDGVYTYTFEDASDYFYIRLEAFFDVPGGNGMDDNTFIVGYDAWWDRGERRAKVLVNGVEAPEWDRRNPYSFTKGKAITFKLLPPEDREGETPIVDIRPSGKPTLSTELGNITLSNDLSFTYTPNEDRGFEVEVWWSTYDHFCSGDDEFLVQTRHWGDGTVQVSQDVANDKKMNEPNDHSGVKRIYANSVIETTGLTVTITPKEGFHVQEIWYDLDGNGSNVHNHYVSWTPGEGEMALLTPGNGFTEKNGVYTYAFPASAMNSSTNLNVGFERDATGIVLNTWGAGAEYRLGTSGDFIKLDDEDNEIDRSIFENATVVQIRCDQLPGGPEIKGVNYVRRAPGQEDDVRLIKFVGNNILTLNREGDAWPSIEIEFITWDCAFDNEYRIENRSEEELHLKNGKAFDTNYSFTQGQAITFSFEEEPYYVRVSPNWRQMSEVVRGSNGTYTYTPTEDRALRFEVFMTQEAYEFDSFQPNHDDGQFSANYSLNLADNVVYGSSPLVTYGNVVPIDSKTYGHETRLILKDVTSIPMTITVPSYIDYRVNVDGENPDEVTAAVKANGNVYNWDVSEPWNIKHVGIDIFYKLFDISVDGGWANTPNAEKGRVVDIGAGPAPEGKYFHHWEVVSGGVTISNPYAENTSFVMQTSNVSIRAIWDDASNLLEAEFKHTCSFQNKIEVNFKVTATLTEYDEWWLSLERQVYSGAGEEYSWKSLELHNYVMDGVRYVYTYDDIAPAEMGDEIRAKFCARKGDKVYESAVDVYSVKDYCRGRLENSTDKKFRKLIVDTLNYGAAAQIKFEKNTNNLVNDILTDDWKKEGTQGNPTLVSVNDVTTIGGKTAKVANKSVSFQSGVELNLFTTYGGSEPSANVKVVLSYLATSGKTITQTVTSDKFIESPKDGVMRYRATFDCVATADFGQPLTIKIFDGSTQISETYTYSIETYAFNRLKDSTDDNFKVLLNAMMNYSQSAQDYFTPANNN